MRFRLITWNIHKGIGGLDRRYRLDRIIDVLQRYTPDIVLMQEVTEGVPRSHRDTQMTLIGDALGLPHRAYQKNVRLAEGHYGNGILSRFPLHDLHDIDLKIPLKKQRRAQVARARLKTDDGHQRSLILINVHLGLAEFERRIQLRRVLESDLVRRAHHDTPFVVAGDMNDLLLRAGRDAFVPAGFQSGADAIPTFPAFMPLRALDQIHYRGRIALDRCIVCPSRVAARASDHLPLIADFTLQ